MQNSHPGQPADIGLWTVVTEATLTLEHVEMLIRALVLEGEIEELSTFSILIQVVVDSNEEQAFDDDAESSKEPSSRKASGKRQYREVFSDALNEDSQRPLPSAAEPAT
ncbi:hypothetical protein C8Q77DRAFT_226706 [Trametes polyzona]|nr:hypothetical protein C8Q77DRAFT_226706 [Trametes polyzona]